MLFSSRTPRLHVTAKKLTGRQWSTRLAWLQLEGSSGGDLPCSTLPRFLCGAALLAVGRGLDGDGDVLCLVAGGRRLSGAVQILPHVAGRVGPRLSQQCPLPRCWRGGASAEPTVSSASLLAPRGLGGELLPRPPCPHTHTHTLL